MMRIASKSVIGLVSSNGFERNKATLLGGPSGTRRGISRDSLAGPSFPGSGGYRFQEGHRKTLCFRLTCWSEYSGLRIADLGLPRLKI